MSVLPFLSGRECGKTKNLREVQELLEARAADPTINKPCQLLGQARSTFLMDFSADRRKIASTHGDHSVRVTDLATGRCTHVLTGHPRTPWCLAFHPSSNEILASGCLGGEVRIWDLHGGGSEVYCAPGDHVIASMAFHPSDHVLVFATSNTLYFWDWNQPEPFTTCKTREVYERIRWVRFGPLGHCLYTGIANGSTIQREEPAPISNISDTSSDARYDSRQRMLRQRYRTLLTRFQAYQSNRVGSNPLGAPERGVPRPLFRADGGGGIEHDILSMEGAHSPANEEALDLAQEYAAHVTENTSRLRNSRSYAASVTQDARRAMLFEQHGLNRPIPQGPELQARLRQARDNLRGGNRRARGASSPPPRRSAGPFETNGSEPVSAGRTQADVLSMSDTVRDISSIQRPLFVNTSDANPSLTAARERTRDLIRGESSVMEAWANSVRQSASSPNIPRTTAEPSLVDMWSNSVRQSLSSPLASPRLGGEFSPSGSSRSRNSAASSPGGTSILRNRLNAAQDNSNLPSISLASSSHSSATKTTPVVIFGREESAFRHSNLSSGHGHTMPNTQTSVGNFNPASSSAQNICSNISSVTQSTCTPSAVTRDVSTCKTVICSSNVDSTSATGPNVRKRRNISSASNTINQDVSISQSERSCNLRTPSLIHASSSNEAQSTGTSERLSRKDNGKKKAKTSARENTTADSNMDSRCGSSASCDSENAESPRIQGSGTVSFSCGDRSKEKSPAMDTDSSVSDTSRLSGSGANSENITGMNTGPSIQHPRAESEREGVTPVSQPLPSSSTLPSSRRPPDLSLLGFRRIPSEALLATSVLPVSQSEADVVTNDSITVSETSGTNVTETTGQNSSSLICDNAPTSLSRTPDVRDLSSNNIGRVVSNTYQGVSLERPLPTPVLSNAESTDEHSNIRNMTSRLAQEINVLGRMIAMRERFSERLQVLQDERNEALANRSGQATPSPPPARIPEITITHHQAESSGSAENSSEQQDLPSPVAGIAPVAVPPSDSPPDPTPSGLPPPPESALQGLDRAWRTLQRRHLHPHYGVSILDETINRPNDALQAAINRAIAGAFMGTGEAAVASNIINLTHRIQCWDFSQCLIPDISQANSNVVVPYCKIHNDSSCDISQDGTYLATFVPSHRGFPDDTILAVFSLLPASCGECLFTKSFGPNAISVSISPLKTHLVVGLASRRLSWVYTTSQVVGQVYKLRKPKAGEDSMSEVTDIHHPCDLEIQSHISVNSVRWLPEVGEGLIYGTNKGDLHICRPGNTKIVEKEDREENIDTTNNMGHNLMNFSRTISAAIQTLHRSRRTAATQTEQPGQAQASTSQQESSTREDNSSAGQSQQEISTSGNNSLSTSHEEGNAVQDSRTGTE